MVVEQNREDIGRYDFIHRVAGEGLTKQVTLHKALKDRREPAWRKSFLGRGYSKGKGPGAGVRNIQCGWGEYVAGREIRVVVVGWMM